MFVCQLDAEYELEEVWDGKQWHVTKKLVPKKPVSSKDSEKPRELATEITFCSIMMITSQSNPVQFISRSHQLKHHKTHNNKIR